MATTDNAQEASHNTTEGFNHQLSQQLDKATKVYVRLMFIRIGEIDTLNEKYQASAAIQASWRIDFDKLLSNLSSNDQKRLSEGKSISLPKYNENNWHPQLYIENALGYLKEQITYSAKRFKHDNKVYICEHRDIKGVFWEKLELQHFPSDIQELSISIASILYDDKVVLHADPYHSSGVNREAFVDQQEWSLYAQVHTQERFVKEFFLQDEDDEDEDIANGKEDRKRSILTVTCYAARQSNYFYWNGYCLIFLITIMSFCVFAIPPNLPANRIQIQCLLLLTSITFRWTVNRSLPTISYLTIMDIYAIICIFILVAQVIWHAIIGSIIFLNTLNNVLKPYMWFVILDRAIFYVVIGAFIIMHIALLTWLYFIPLKYRRDMDKGDIQYRLVKNRKKSKEEPLLSKNFGTPSSFLRIPIQK